jgi:hypothetical protein
VTDFTGQDLRGSIFDRADLSGSRFWAANLSRSQIRGAAMHKVEMRGVELVDVDISGEIVNVTINGVEVGALVEAELDRRSPDRMKMRPIDADGFREAWGIVERLWAQTVERARRLAPEQLHTSVDEEWSFVETLRHLVFATDSWLRRAVLGDPAPWHPLGLPWDEMPPAPGVPWDRAARPDLDTVLELRRDRMAGVRAFLGELTDDQLGHRTEPVEGPGWPPPVSFEIRECLLIILSEEWEHRRYAERDLAVLENRGRAGGAPDSGRRLGRAC